MQNNNIEVDLNEKFLKQCNGSIRNDKNEKRISFANFYTLLGYTYSCTLIQSDMHTYEKCAYF